MTTSTAGNPVIPDEPRGGAATWYEVLDLAPSATPADVQRAYDRALALVEGRSIGGYFLLDPVAVESVRADIEAAWTVLRDPARRAGYDVRIGNAATLIPHSSADTRSDEQEPIGSHEGEDITASDARRLLGLPSTPSGEGVFAPLSPEARAQAKTGSSSPPPVTISGKPRGAGLKFLKPVDDQQKSAITFAPPRTDEIAVPTSPPTSPPTASGTSSAPTANASELPTSTAEPELQATLTVLPTAAMPPPKSTPPTATSPGTSPVASSGSNLPVNVTPSPMPGLFSLEGQEVNGQLLKRLREARGLSLAAMVEATKIRKPYLMAIEEQDLENLPARVYLRGFLTQIARVLRVDKVKLADGYLAFVARYGK